MLSHLGWRGNAIEPEEAPRLHGSVRNESGTFWCHVCHTCVGWYKLLETLQRTSESWNTIVFMLVVLLLYAFGLEDGQVPTFWLLLVFLRMTKAPKPCLHNHPPCLLGNINCSWRQAAKSQKIEQPSETVLKLSTRLMSGILAQISMFSSNGSFGAPAAAAQVLERPSEITGLLYTCALRMGHC